MHEKSPVRPGQAQFVADLELAVNPAGAYPPWHEADVQFDLIAGTRRVGQREGADADIVGQLQIDVLARLEIKDFIVVQFDPDPLDRRCQFFNAADDSPVIANRQIARIRVDLDFNLDDRIRFKFGATGQRLALF